MIHHIVKICLYFHRLGNAAGGAERMICQLANALADRGLKVYVVSWDSARSQTFYPLHRDVTWIRLGFDSGIWDKLRRIFELYAVLKQNKIRVVVGFVMSGDKTVYTAVKLAGIRLVVAERNAPTMYTLRYNLAQRVMMFGFLHLADCITVQLPDYINGYSTTLRNRIVSIPNPVPAAQNHAKPDVPNSAGRFTILAVSRLDRIQKRVDLLISAFSRLAAPYPDWDLRIVGDGQELDNLLQRVKELGIVSRVRIEASTSQIFGAYRQAHLFAIPSRWEGFSNALAEAMSHGLPAVGFVQAAGVSELIGGDGGWLADGLDDEISFAECLALAMSDGCERAKRGAAAARRMAQFVPDAQYDRWAALLTSLTRNREG